MNFNFCPKLIIILLHTSKYFIGLSDHLYHSRIRTKFGRTSVAGDLYKDRLSDLPECIILHILSFLGTKLAVRTCVLSTRWKHLWKRIPTLTLNSFEFSTLKIFSVFLSKILSLRDTSTALHAFDLRRGRNIEPRLLKKFLKCVSSHSTHLQRLGISLNGDTGLILKCVSSCRALTSLKLSLRSKWSDPTEILFPKSLNLPLLTSLDLAHFAFCGDESGCAEPFLEFTKLNSLVIYDCKVIDAQILTISSETLVNLTMNYNSSLLAKIKLYAPNLCTFDYTGSHHFHEISGSGFSLVKKVNIKSRRFSASMEDALVLFNWLLNFVNIESLTVTSTVLQILSLVPDLFEVKLRSLHNLKSLKVKLIGIQEGSLLELIEDDMLKKAAAKSPEEVAKLREAFETCLEPPAIPDGIVDFLRQNSPSAEVNITTKYPSSFNLKQIEESIKGAKINNYRSRFSVPSSSGLP
ncbi:putative F-box/FBD/LRR-repeat protein At4g13965 [Vicia villosa]|uniref:putative F-box/FBD/LRR-repeat protein At4g13965 n=1 Tax=Vicia villosa TaxID=3911 RepID=UPI00273B0A75|nr:putative F-box/FBD/LRR-repeat protein At4g13965 [Vicia villosa]